MIDQLINGLKDKVGGDLMKQVGLDAKQTDGAMKAAGDTVKEVIGGGKGVDMDSVLNLFSSGSNSSGANDLMSRMGGEYLGKLTAQVGLSPDMANKVSAMVMPALTSMISDKVGGNKDMLSSLLGGAGKGLLGDLQGKMGGLGKLFK